MILINLLQTKKTQNNNISLHSAKYFTYLQMNK